MGFDVRRVVTGHDDAGRSVFVSDGTPPRTIDVPNGYGVSDLLYVGGPPASAFDAGDPPDGPWALEPPPGGCTVRLIRIPPPAADAPEADRWIRVDIEDPDRPGMHTTDTLDFEVIVDGSIVLGLDDGEHELHAGDVVVQRGTAHRWRVTGDRPCTYAAFMFRTDPDAPPPAVELATRTDGAGAGVGPRRLVTATGPDGRSSAVADGPAPTRVPARRARGPRDRRPLADRRAPGPARPGRRLARPVRARPGGRRHRVPVRRVAARRRPGHGGLAHHHEHRPRPRPRRRDRARGVRRRARDPARAATSRSCAPRTTSGVRSATAR